MGPRGSRQSAADLGHVRSNTSISISCYYIRTELTYVTVLDWIADLENPKKKERRDNIIRCPQCKTEIKVARPTSYILNAVKALDRSLAVMTLPGLGLVFSGMILTGCWAHGFQSVYAVFGPAEAERIFFEATTSQTFFYALIPINLIAARTRYANSILSTGTFALLSTQINPHRFELDLTIWPPLPSTVFICLPTVRRLYNWLYDLSFADFNKRMIEAVQPQSTQTVDTEEANLAEIANQNALAEGDLDGEVILEVQLDIGGGDAADGEGAPEEGADGEGEINGQQNGNGNGNAHVHQIGEIVEGIGIGSTVLGALAFPYVATAMGHALSLALPASWMSSANMLNGRPGLLRNQWGRSVVGGAIFVVLKDALLLYSRWKRAQSHKMRRIVDYDKRAKKYLM